MMDKTSIKNPAPIALFVYNRPWHTKLTLEALSKNKFANESILHIFADGPKKNTNAEYNKISEVRQLLTEKQWCKEVIIRKAEKNKGLAHSIIDGVTEIVNQYGKVIVLEDDLITSQFFLEFMNKTLDLYESDPEVASIHGYVYNIRRKLPETFFIKGADCWGWATWKRSWDLFESDGNKLLMEIEKRKLQQEFDFNGSYPYFEMLKDQNEGRINSWAIRWYASAFLNNKLTLYPGRSLVFHNGNDGTGSHFVVSNIFDVSLSQTPIVPNRLPLKENQKARKLIENYFRYKNDCRFKTLFTKIRKFLKRY